MYLVFMSQTMFLQTISSFTEALLYVFIVMSKAMFLTILFHPLLKPFLYVFMSQTMFLTISSFTEAPFLRLILESSLVGNATREFKMDFDLLLKNTRELNILAGEGCSDVTRTKDGARLRVCMG